MAAVSLRWQKYNFYISYTFFMWAWGVWGDFFYNWTQKIKNSGSFNFKYYFTESYWKMCTFYCYLAEFVTQDTKLHVFYYIVFHRVKYSVFFSNTRKQLRKFGQHLWRNAGQSFWIPIAGKPTITETELIFEHVNCIIWSRSDMFKGTVQREFRPPVFFIIRTHLGPW